MQKNPKDNRSSNLFELHEERLATTNETGSRVYLYPAAVKGFFRNVKTILSYVLIALFLILPWLSFGGQQLVLLDIIHRRFSLFGLTFWAHEAPILVLVFLVFVLLIGFVTTLFGRVWCGYACPQTVFVDGVYRKIEEMIEGSAAQRRRLDQAPWGLSKLFKRTLKWGLYLAITLVITHSFLAYFVGAENVLGMITQSPSEHPLSFVMVLVTSLIILFDFGWFREQFCIIACPYGRFQSVMMDEHSLVIAYDEKRGEPRKKEAADVSADSDGGDCINCYRCVQVCPTGIDIRRGVQMECIMCTACIDACNTVMTKIDKPKNLIRYDTETGIKGGKTKWLRFRVGLYAVLLVVVSAMLGFVVMHRDMVPVTLVRSHQAPYTQLENSQLQNQFFLSVKNQYFYPITVSFKLDEQLLAKGVTWISPFKKQIKLASGESRRMPVFVRFDASLIQNGKSVYTFEKIVAHHDTHVVSKERITLLGPL